MSDLLTKAAYYKLAIFYFVLFSFNSLATAIVASFLNTEWNTLTATSKFLLIVVIVQNWSGTMIAYFNKTLSRLQEGQPLFGSDTTTITKKDT